MQSTKNIAVLGAGRSSGVLINYLLKESLSNDWTIFISDVNRAEVEKKISNHANGRFLKTDIPNDLSSISSNELGDIVATTDLHYKVAEYCVNNGIHFISASYNTSEIQSLHQKAIENNVIVLMECGLDPGIDHMSAMKEIEEIKETSGKIISFESYCGGLVALESDDNPWHYKISWNPRNVVLAGQGGNAKYLKNNKIVEIDYKNLFLNAKNIEIDEYGNFDGYPNRDSLSYIELYGLKGIENIIRGTLRKKGFCNAWQILIELGYTDNQLVIPIQVSTLHELTQYLEEKHLKLSSLKGRLLELFPSEKERNDIILKLEYLGIFMDAIIPTKNQTPAEVLQHILEHKWKLLSTDKDMVVMKHQIKYELGNENFVRNCDMVLIGNDKGTAMATTVGLPLGIIAKLLMSNQISKSGVHIPINPEIFEPTLTELKINHIYFTVTSEK